MEDPPPPVVDWDVTDSSDRGNEAAAVKQIEQLKEKVKQEEMCQTSVAQKLGVCQMMIGLQRCGGHRGGARSEFRGRVKI